MRNNNKEKYQLKIDKKNKIDLMKKMFNIVTAIVSGLLTNKKKSLFF